MEAQFGAASNIGIEQVAKFLAWSGVSPDEAEQWHPWATAYIEMDLKDHPTSIYAQILKQARDLARKRITDNPAWVLNSVHLDAPGNYNPALEQSRAAKIPQASASQQKAEPTVPTPQPQAEPSLPITSSEKPIEDFAQTRITVTDEEDFIQILGWGDEDEDTRMGPG
jgi:hypothetical protein